MWYDSWVRKEYVIIMKMNDYHPAFEEKEKENLYKIGMFASMNRVTIKTLRYYDEQKLLIPVYVDEENGYRYYKAGQMAQLQRIIALKNMGFSIDDIRKIIDGAEEKSFLLEKKQGILKSQHSQPVYGKLLFIKLGLKLLLH